MIPKHIIHLLSGGVDSVVLLYDLHQQGISIHCVMFDYGQIHRCELKYAKKHCDALAVKYTQVELLQRRLFKTSALTDGKGSDIVPNRNAVFLNIAASLAMSSGAESVTIGCNKEDQQRFPDCSWEFIEAMNATLKVAQVPVEICAPYIGMTKWQIVQRAKKIGAPYEDTVSCYKGTNCGKCDACKKRAIAIA